MKKRIYVAGHKGMVGSAIVRNLCCAEDVELVLKEKNELNLLDAQQVNDFFVTNKIDEVYLAAAKVGGILANNNFPAEFIYQNLMIECNIIHASHIADVNKLLFLGSSCIYPKFAKQPISESELLTGVLEGTNEPYAIAKIAGIKLCESYSRQYGRDYRTVMPTNLYGMNDNFNNTTSHVIPALIRRFHDAKINKLTEVIVWGSGNPKREFLYVDDMAEASIFVMNATTELHSSYTTPMSAHLNIGSGKDYSIRELAEMIASVVGFEGVIQFDSSKPDGTPRKLLDVKKINSMGWSSKVDLIEGLKTTYEWFVSNQMDFRQ